jgi:PAS domain S-box-containing protein
MSFLQQIFNSADLSPHGVCLLWQPGLIWLHVVSDALIGLAYYSIPLALTVFVLRRRDLQFGWLFWLFGAFILACGTTHFMSIWTLWHPDYGIEGILKALTALLSIGTAAILWPLLPRGLALPSAASLEKQVLAREAALVQLQDSEDLYRELYNRTPGLLFSTDERGRIMEVSDDLLQLLGYQREEMVGRSAAHFMSPAAAELMRTALWSQFLATGELREIDLQFTRADNTVVETLLSARVQNDADGQFQRVYAVLVDITARRAAEQALAEEIEARNRMREMLHQSQKMEAVGQLTGGVAHDFNNLLTAVNGNLDLLRSRYGNTEAKLLRLVEAAQMAVQRGAKLTKQLLSFSRRQVLRPEIFNLAARFDGLHTLLASTLQGSVRLEIKLDADLWNVMADPTEFDLAIINLCVNARDAMPGGGTLTITGQNMVLPAGSFVRLGITDTGCGMPPEVASRVFEPFFTTKEPGKGTGLGLSQVYGFVTQSNGFVGIESAVGKGTTVLIDLPQAGALPQSVAPQPAVSEAALSGHVLLVEDDDDVANAAMALIEDLGFTVERFAQPAPALARLKEGDKPAGGFDLLFSDIVMPGGMNGLDFAKQVQALFPDLPIILTTGHSQAAAQAGSEFFILPKPYSREQLVAVFANSR